MKKNKSLLISCILAVMLSAIITGKSLGQEKYNAMNNIEAFTQNMQQASERTSSISSDFVQYKHLSFLEEDVESKGVFYFEKKDKLRWEYTSPFYYLIIFKGDTVLIQDDNKTNIYDASSGRMFREINNIMLSMVDGSILESDNFSTAYFENDEYYILELIPQAKNMQDFLSGIRIFVNKNDYSADELLMLERSGDYTHIRFLNKRLNEDIPEHIFDLH